MGFAFKHGPDAVQDQGVFDPEGKMIVAVEGHFASHDRTAGDIDAMRVVRRNAGGPLGPEHYDPADVRGSSVRLGVIDRETGPAIEKDQITRFPTDIATAALFDAARAPFQDKALDSGPPPSL